MLHALENRSDLNFSEFLSKDTPHSRYQIEKILETLSDPFVVPYVKHVGIAKLLDW
jgi:hypothetical protein